MWLAMIIEVKFPSAGEYYISCSRGQAWDDGLTIGSWKSEREFQVVSPFEASVESRSDKRVELL
jgi:hypothetical protein